jgi:hypothetical protein
MGAVVVVVSAADCGVASVMLAGIAGRGFDGGTGATICKNDWKDGAADGSRTVGFIAYTGSQVVAVVLEAF